MHTPHTTTTRRPCACRGAGTCPNCDQHICTGQCVCDTDGAPQESIYGYGNPSNARLEAWREKQEARR